MAITGYPNSSSPQQYGRRADRIPKEASCLRIWAKKTSFSNLYNSSSKVFQKFFIKDSSSSSKCLLTTFIFIATLITAVVLHLLFLPIHLLLLGTTYCCPRKELDDDMILISPPKVLPPTIRTLTPEEQEIVEGVKSFIKEMLWDAKGKPKKYLINMAPSSLRKSPELSPFLKELMQTTSATCNYRKLKSALKKVGAWDTNWEKIIMPYLESAQKELDHPDKKTFPILMHFLLRALQDPDISQEKKRKAALFISNSAYTCKPTWAEITNRALTQLYSKSKLGANQLLIWVQEAKEKLLLPLHENRAQQKEARFSEINLQESQFGEEEWHIINGMKFLYGEEFGLITHHLQPNLEKLTLRQTQKDFDYEPYKELCQTFKAEYQGYGMQLVNSVFQAYSAAEAENKTTVRDYALSLIEELINLPGTPASADILAEYLCDEEFELSEQGIAYLLFMLEIIQFNE